MMPDLPMPVRMTRPRQSRSSSTARSNRSSSRGDEREDRRGFGLEHLARQREVGQHGARRRISDGSDDGIDLHQLAEQRLEQIEPQRVLRVALRARRLLVHFEEHAVDAGGDARATPAARCTAPAPPSRRRRRRAAAGCA